MIKVLRGYSRLVIALLPWLYLPVVLDQIGFGRMWILMATGVVGLLGWGIVSLSGEKELRIGRRFWLWLLMAVWMGVSFWKLGVGGRMRSMMMPFGVGGWLTMFVWVFLWMQLRTKEEYEKQLKWLSVSMGLLGVVGLVLFLLPQKMFPINLPKEQAWLSIGSQNWSIFGLVAAEMVFYFWIAFEWLKKLVAKLKDNQSNYWLEAAVGGVFGLFGLVAGYKFYASGWGLDINTSWQIAAETFKRFPVFGMGSGNFVEAFNLFRPASFNSSAAWAGIFGISGMSVLQVWTELGTVGLLIVAMMFLTWRRSGVDRWDFWMGVLLAVVVLVLPASLPLWILWWWQAIMKSGMDVKVKPHLSVGEGRNAAGAIMMGVVALVAAGSGYWLFRTLMGEAIMRSSLVSASKNEAVATYEKQIKAIGHNPYMADYRRLYSQTNLAMAQAILSKKDATDQDKEQASVLLQQSVREAKAAAALEPTNSIYWSNLAAIYRSMVGSVEGAPDWAFQAYSQAIALDPVNPVLKMDLGGLLYAAGRYPDADRVFEEAVSAKQDYANAWYNWAHSAKQQNRLGDAVNRMTQAVSLVSATSGDFDKASEELATWKKELEEAIKQQEEAIKQQQEAAAQQKQPETLKTAEPIPTVAKDDMIPVSEEIKPEITITPTTAPTATPTQGN